MSQSKRRPSSAWHLLAVLIFVVGIGISVATAISEARSFPRSFQKLDAHGTNISLRAGEHSTVWAVWDRSLAMEHVARPEVKVSVVGPDGSSAFFRPAGSSRITFSFGKLSGINLGKIVSTKSGTHVVKVTFTGSEEGDSSLRAALGGRSISGMIFRIIRPTVLALGASVVWVILISVLRAFSRRAAVPEYHPSDARSGSGSGSGPFV